MAYILSELNVSCKLLKHTIMDSKSASFHFKKMSNHLSLTKKNDIRNFTKYFV